MLPRLTAEEDLRARDQIAVGTGAFKKADAQRIVSGWIDRATGGTRPRAAKASRAALEDIGIGVRVHG